MICTRLLGSLVLTALALSLPVACSSSSDSGKKVDVTEADYTVTTKVANVAAGDVTFKIHNTGTFVHEFVVFKVASVADIPVKDTGEADEDAVPEAEHMGEVEDIQPGQTAELKLNLAAGKYVLLCNRVDGTISHYKRGMHSEFSVT
jgi:uncharacterized cupredoxin-like copper-binding protein